MRTSRFTHPLWVRWPWWVGLGSLGAAAALAWTVWSPPIHRVRAQILLLPQPESLGTQALLLSGNTATPLTILHGVFDSDAVVLDLSQKFQIPEARLRQMWFVRSDPVSNQIEIIADAPSAKLAQQLVDRSIQKARELEVQSAETAAGARAKQLQATLAGQMRGVTAAERNFSQLLISVPAPVGGPQEAASALGSATQLEADLASRRAQRDLLKSKLGASLSERDLPKSGKLDDLRQSVRRLEEEQSAAQRTYGPEAPELRRVQERLDVTRDLYERELDRAKESLRQGLIAQIADIESSIASLEYRASQLANLRQAAPAASAQVASGLKRLRQAYTAASDVRARFERARVDAEVERVNWSVLTPAFAEERPINKRYVRNPLAGGALGALAGALLVFLIPLRSKPRPNLNPSHEDTWPNAA